VERAAAALAGPRQAQWLERLDVEYGNLRAGLERGRSVPNARETYLRLAGALGPYWYARSYAREGRPWLDDALAATRGEASGARSRALCAAGRLAYLVGDHAHAAEYFEEALSLGRRLGDRETTADSLTSLGAIAARRNEYDQAETLLSEALDSARDMGDERATATALVELGSLANYTHDVERAMGCYEESLALVRKLGDTRGTARALLNLAALYRRRADNARARAYFEECLDLVRELHDEYGICAATSSLGALCMDERDLERAGQLLEESVIIARRLGDKHWRLFALFILGIMANHQGEQERAGALASEVDALSRATDSKLYQGGVAILRGHVARASKKMEEAEAHYARALEIYRKIGNEDGVAYALEAFAAAAAARKEPRRALRLAGAAEEIRRRLGMEKSDFERVALASFLDPSRRMLGLGKAARAFEEGRTMPSDEAVALALEGD
jgi:tetratricopeptide (TPR) repeat protein